MHRFPVVALSIVLTIALAASARANGNAIVFSVRPNGPNDSTIPLTIIGADTNSSGVFFVRQEPPSGEAIGVRLMTQLVDEVGQQVSGASISFTAQEPISGTAGFRSVDATTTGFTLPKDGTPVQVKVTVSNLQQTGTFTGTVIAYVAETPTLGPNIKVVRQAAPQLQWFGATDSGYALTSKNAQFDYPFQIESLNSTSTTLSVLVNSFVGSNGVQIEPNWDVTASGQTYKSSELFTLNGLQSATVQVNATLPLTGTYHSGLTLIYGNQRQTTDLTVTRSRPPLPIKVTGIETATAILGPLLANDPQIWFNLTSTDAQTNTVITPTLASLSLVGANAGLTQAQYDSIEVTVGSDEPTPAPVPLTLGPGQTQRVALIVTNLQQPGEYQGTLQISALDARPIERQIKILARDSWWVAAFFIFLGILVSEIIRILAKTVRPRLRQQMKLRLALEELESQDWKAEELTDGEKEVLQGFASRLRSQYALATIGEDKDSDALINEIHDKLPLFSRWVELRRRIGTISPDELQARFRRDLAPIGVRLANAGEQITTIEDDLNTLQEKISTELKAAVLKQVRELKDKLDSWPGAPESAKTALTAVTSLADQAAKLSDAQLAEAQDQFNAARQEYLLFLIQDLNAHLNGPRPTGFEQQEWEDLKKRVKGKLQNAEEKARADVDSATKLFEEAYADYLHQAIEVLRRSVSDRQKQLKELESLHEKDSAKLMVTQDGLTKVTAITDRLNGASTKIAKKELGPAANTYDQAQKDLKGVIEMLNSAGVSMGAGSLALAFAGSLLGLPFAAIASEQPIEPRPGFTLDLPSVSALRFAQWGTELLVGVIALAAAVVLGLNLLYFNSPTWGGGAAYVLAVLWGLGLHQAAGQTFDGLTKFIDARSA